jgi:hypothetical protein
MEARTMRDLAGLIARHHRGDRDDNGTGQQPAFDTTVGEDSGGDQGLGSGDAGCDTDSPGQGGNNIPG